jgi:multisubunit Na+/H+ antiporter MnhE subunit
MARRKILLERRKRSSNSGRDKGQEKILKRFSFRLWLADVAILIPLWFILVGKLTWSELVMALAAAPVAASVTEATRSIGFARFYPRLRWLLHLRQVPGEVLRDCSILIAVLTGRIVNKRQERGFFKIIPFHSGGVGARSAARRALAIILGTLSPNTCVVDIEPHNNFALLHQIRAERSPDFILNVRKE